MDAADDAPPDTDPGGHEPPPPEDLSPLPHVEIPGAPPYFQRLFDEQREARNETRALRKELRAHMLDESSVFGAYKEHGERITAAEGDIQGIRDDLSTLKTAVGDLDRRLSALEGK